MKLVRYGPPDAARWDRFIRGSKNGTFLFERGYMDYHADRFQDHSLIVLDDHERVIATLPAHQLDGGFVSHDGLTYGGVVSDRSMTTQTMLDIFDAISSYLLRIGLCTWRYKTIPHVYHSIPAEEDRYALFRTGALRTRVDVLSVIPREPRIEFKYRRERRIRVGGKAGLALAESNEFAEFWRILEENLESRHRTTPVHSLAEISMLHTRFPEHIRLHLCRQGASVVAGAVIYDTGTVAHAQYLAASSRGREIGGLDYLLAHLIREIYAHRKYFDLGASNEQDGHVLNRGLIEQKEGFGAHAVAHEFFELSIA